MYLIDWEAIIKIVKIAISVVSLFLCLFFIVLPSFRNKIMELLKKGYED